MICLKKNLENGGRVEMAAGGALNAGERMLTGNAKMKGWREMEGWWRADAMARGKEDGVFILFLRLSCKEEKTETQRMG